MTFATEKALLLFGLLGSLFNIGRLEPSFKNVFIGNKGTLSSITDLGGKL